MNQCYGCIYEHKDDEKCKTCSLKPFLTRGRSMKTKDGHDVELNKMYYLENGQEVYISSCATTSDGRDAFMVTPFYEGEAMQASGDGGSHHEISMMYEHEGLETLVFEIFKAAPTEKLDSRYAAKLKDIEHLSLSVGILKLNSTDLNSAKSKLAMEIKIVEETLLGSRRKLDEAQEALSALDSMVSEKRQKLSILEDSICDLKAEDVSSLVSKTELQRLNKRDFKLDCLEAGGVDNWEWYDESLEAFRKRYPED